MWPCGERKPTFHAGPRCLLSRSHPGYSGRKLIVHIGAGHKGRHGAAVAPTVGFRMAVGEREAAREVMIVTGQIVKPIGSRLVRPPGHARREVAHVYAVFAHVEKNKD